MPKFTLFKKKKDDVSDPVVTNKSVKKHRRRRRKNESDSSTKNHILKELKEPENPAAKVLNTIVLEEIKVKFSGSENSDNKAEESVRNVVEEKNIIPGLLGNLNNKPIKLKLGRNGWYLEHDEGRYPIMKELDPKSIDLEKAKKIINDSPLCKEINETPNNITKLNRFSISSSNASESSSDESSSLEEDQENNGETKKRVHFEPESSEDTEVESSEQLANKTPSNNPSYFFTGTKKIYVVALVSFALGWLVHTNQMQVLVDKFSNAIGISHILKLIWKR